MAPPIWRPDELPNFAIKPRDVDSNPRCDRCQTRGMRHPEHRWGRCQVKPVGEEQCQCSVADEIFRLTVQG